jgi:hypothetical protein
MLLDENDGTLILFQLKWMEPFANNMQLRASKQRNFKKSSDKWINDVLEWVAIKGIDALLGSWAGKTRLKKLKGITSLY